MTSMVSKILRVVFGSVEAGTIPNIDIGTLMEIMKDQLAARNMAAMLN